MLFWFDKLFNEFEFKNYFITFAVLLIVYLSWESTYVREPRLRANTVLIIENNQRVLVDIGDSQNTTTDESVGERTRVRGVRRVVNNNSFLEEVRREESETRHLETGVSSADGLVDQAYRSENHLQFLEPPPSMDVIIDEVNDLVQEQQPLNGNTYRTLETLEEDINFILEENDQQNIIRDMDAPNTAESIRRRRLAFYEHQSPGSSQSSQELGGSRAISNSEDGAGDTIVIATSSESCYKHEHKEDRSNVENKNIVSRCSDELNLSTGNLEEFRIKLKYLNDEIKLVKGSPSENIGDFKKRNFTLELAAQKLVRLVFNGHVLQPDSTTLQACGLFDNCVVHCLVHNTTPNVVSRQTIIGSDTSDQGERRFYGQSNTRTNSAQQVFLSPNHDQSSSRLIVIYTGLALLILFLTFCWYCRIQYHLFFSWYSTMGLVLVTVIISIFVPLFISIENDLQQLT